MYRQILSQAEKSCRIPTLQLIRFNRQEWRKRFIEWAPDQPQIKLEKIDQGLYYKSFYVRNLLMFFVIYKFSYLSRIFVPVRPLQPSLIFVKKVIGYRSEAPFKCSTLGQALGLTHKHSTKQERPARHKIIMNIRKLET